MLGKNIDLKQFLPDKIIKKSRKKPRPIKPYAPNEVFDHPENNLKWYFYKNPDSIFIENNHFVRLKNIYLSVQEKGYIPEKFSHSFQEYFIRGIILKKMQDYRFVIVGGKHRTAVLAALGYEQIPVTFKDNDCRNLKYPQILDYKNIENFPIVKNIYPKQIAKEIFNLYFEDDGTEKAKVLNLI